MGRTHSIPTWTRAVLAPVLALAITAAVSRCGAVAQGAVVKPASATIDAAVDPSRPGPPVPKGFVGLSFESSALPAVARAGQVGNLAHILRSLGPGVMRFGGSSIDSPPHPPDRSRLAWAPPPAGVPRRADLVALRALLVRTGWRVVLSVPLGQFEPESAARELALEARILGHRLSGVEVGNEPNAYWINGLRPAGFGLPRYLQQLRAYRRAFASLAPGVPFLGPDTVTSLTGSALSAYDGMRWMAGVAGAMHPAELTPHLYPLSACSRPAPTSSELLGGLVQSREVRALARLGAIGHAHRIPVRIDEANSAGCGGEPGVSDTLAGALWAVRFTDLAIHAGMVGINFHTLLGYCSGYSPMCAGSPADLAAGRLRALPELSALRLAIQLVGARPLPISASPQRPGVSLDAFATARGPAILAVDSRPPPSPPITLRLHVPGATRVDSRLVLRGGSLTNRALALASPAGGWEAGAGGEVSVALGGPGAQLITLGDGA